MIDSYQTSRTSPSPGRAALPANILPKISWDDYVEIGNNYHRLRRKKEGLKDPLERDGQPPMKTDEVFLVDTLDELVRVTNEKEFAFSGQYRGNFHRFGKAFYDWPPVYLTLWRGFGRAVSSEQWRTDLIDGNFGVSLYTPRPRVIDIPQECVAETSLPWKSEDRVPFEYHNPRFKNMPYLVDDLSAVILITPSDRIDEPLPFNLSSNEFHWILCPSAPEAGFYWTPLPVDLSVPEEWPVYDVKLYDKTGKIRVTNVRCRVCGALDKHRYGGPSERLCHIDDDFLCNRKACIDARDTEQGHFDTREYEDMLAPFSNKFSGLRVSLKYWLHDLRFWIKSQERGNGDQNLKCDQRYQLDKRGRKGIKLPHPTDDVHEDAEAIPSRIYTADDIEARWMRCQHLCTPDAELQSADMHAPASLAVTLYDQEQGHVPNFNCFGTASPQNKFNLGAFLVELLTDPDKFDVKLFENTGWTPPKGWSHFAPSTFDIIPQTWWTKAYRLRGVHGLYHAYEDPAVTDKVKKEINKDLRAEFKKTTAALKKAFGKYEIGWRWYGPEVKFHITVGRTLRQTTGAEDVIRNKQLARLKKMQEADHRDFKFIEDIYIRNKKKDAAMRQKVYRTFHKQQLSIDDVWNLATKDVTIEGAYNVGIFHGQPRAYLVLPLDQFADTSEKLYEALENGLHDIVCDILERRIKNGQYKDPGTDNKARWTLEDAYVRILNEFNRQGWRVLKNGKWYDANGSAIESAI